ncbi:uncharacterized protein LOC133908251 [Phragmites australis]|uniref:uncharacterized protein LOC133908251 n=1 Tax=Phragmites australis TaxID=29695 RepID=UPI002D77DB18|nr:uncharacterized protein LOC133908251 [Phragmites australis]
MACRESFDCKRRSVRRSAMSGFGQRSRPWPGPGDSASTPSEPAAAVAAAADARGEASTLKDFGTSMDAISFGFAATAILISLFLLTTIFEHLIKPLAFPPNSPDGRPHAARHRHSRSPGKLRSPPMVRSPNRGNHSPFFLCALQCVHVEAVLQAADLSVLMPGQRYPTYLAQPAPLPPSCHREGVHWPPHDHHNSYMPP